MGSVSGSVHLRRRQVASLCPFLRLSLPPSLSPSFSLSFSSAFFRDSPEKKLPRGREGSGTASRLAFDEKRQRQETVFRFNESLLSRPALVSFVSSTPFSNPRIFLFHRPRSETSVAKITRSFVSASRRTRPGDAIVYWQDFPPLPSVAL